MKFDSNYVRSLDKLLAFTEKHPKVQFVTKVEGAAPETWTDLGFSEKLEPGQCLIPCDVGRFTHFNMHGKEIVRKDLPMTKKSFQVFSTWHDWHGNPHSGIQYRDRDVYVRDYVPGPEEKLYVVQLDSGLHIATREIDFQTESEAAALHLANLMLECLGEFHPIDASSGVVIGNKLKSLQWEVLPPGEYTWSKVQPIVDRITGKMDTSAREQINYRMGRIAGYKPSFVAMGMGGFNAYFVYGFEKKGVFVMESGHLDNATYVFNEDWEKVSQLTKSEIINGGIPHQRIIHDRRWQHNIRKAVYGT